MGRVFTAACLLLAASCADEIDTLTGGSGGAGAQGGGGNGFGGADGGGGASGCSCATGIHETRILVLSDDAEIWSFDPATNAFELVREVPCAIDTPYSMAIDAEGVAWILDAETEDLFTVELEGDTACGDPGYQPGPLQSGFGLFGMAFSSRGAGDLCADLYGHSYSGEGPFGEGPDAGVLGRLDAETLTFQILAGVDYDGGELAGTGDGRLFAFAGVDPVKLVEYDRATGEELRAVFLDGFDKTNASAFSVFAGSVYFFTEAGPVGCDGCLEDNCAAAYASCVADPGCAEILECVKETGVVDGDECSLPSELADCVGGPCVDECIRPSGRVSKVSRLDLADPNAGVELIVPVAPVRVVGAGTSICAPAVPE